MNTSETTDEAGHPTIYEIRNYYFEPSLLGDYRIWTTEKALPYLRSNLDVVGFWLSIDEPTEIVGREMDDLGSATVTWIIRWSDMATRHSRMKEVFGVDAWKAILRSNPGLKYYYRSEVKFAENLLAPGASE